MSDFHSMEPLTRSYALVGNFLFLWALMEAQIREALAKALGLDGLQVTIVNSNLQLRSKINILLTAVDMAPAIAQPEKDRFKKVLQSIAEYSYTRNMMAHDVFGPSEDDTGVQFFVAKAKGKLQFPPTIWTVEKFQEEFLKIGHFRDELIALVSTLGQAALIKALSEAPDRAPTNALLGLGLANPPDHPLQEPLDSSPPESTP